jgi:DNA phosphorothioation-associated putative methyltransferase
MLNNQEDLEFDLIVNLCQNSVLGKHLPNALYVHRETIPYLDPLLQEYEQLARKINQDTATSTLIKFSTEEPKVSYLFYPDFDIEPHPALKQSIVVDVSNETVKCWHYHNSDNPPVLHRKETFVTPDYPLYQESAHLTAVEESLGLLDNSRFIGTRNQWLKLLQAHRLRFEGHHLVCPLSASSLEITIDRHKAAIVRQTLSRPVRIALEAGLFAPGSSFFDYGCGYGGDLERIAHQGYDSSGWDPHYRPDVPLQEADIVNLGYVINVIEDVTERRETLLKAWALTRQVLIVSAQVLIDDRTRGLVGYGDGIITERNTFQKYYEQEELKAYIDGVLHADAIPVGLGIYVVFREPARAHNFRASRFHSQVKAPRVLLPVKRFEDYEQLLTPLMDFYTERGRLSLKGELPEEEQLKQEFGSIKRAFKVILQVTDEEEWEAIADKRRQEILIYLALSRFSHRPTTRQLSPVLKADIKALFDNYQAACFLADEMLLRLRNLELIRKLCAQNPVGKMFPRSFLVHLSALESLPSLLRLYEGCASRTIGRMDRANLVRFYFHLPKIAYLYYPNFDAEPHPVLETRMEIDLRDLQVRYQDFYEDDNPPILHEKDKLVTRSYSLYKKFNKLTKQEKKAGLLQDMKDITRLKGWQRRLKDYGLVIQGHQISAQNIDNQG